MSNAEKRPHAQMRQSQLITTFGPGAMVDLPRYGVLVGGLDFWTEDRRPIYEERLVAKLEAALQKTGLKLFAPPVDGGAFGAPRTGIFVWEFPEWFVADYESGDARRPGVRSRPLIHAESLVRRKYTGPDRKKHGVVPVRFVQTCPNGHLSDVDWRQFVHGTDKSCSRPLWMDERGTSGDLAEIFIRCDCGRSVSLATATLGGGGDSPPLGYCRGKRPWLGRGADEPCVGDSGAAQRNRLLIRSASNAYFAQTLSVISIPDADIALRDGVDRVWADYLQYCESAEQVELERRKQKVHDALEGFDTPSVWLEVSRRKSGAATESKSVKRAELEMLLASPVEAADTPPGAELFYARSIAVPSDSPFAPALERVIRVDRLREVVAQVGFTRLESASPDAEGELDISVRRAELAREVTWLPAVENRGEGFFLSFKRDAIAAWLARPAVAARGGEFLQGFAAWASQHPSSKVTPPGLPYVFLHSLSHLLINAVSLECGYGASSIRERIYAIDGVGYGILLHTGSSDAEGTLGGLVQVSRRIDHHLSRALELGRLCSNDPVCAQHSPKDLLVERFLHGAACHGCLLIAEPSCERRNEFLDRALVVATVEAAGAEFFAESGA